MEGQTLEPAVAGIATVVIAEKVATDAMKDKEDCSNDDDDCGPDTRATAFLKALAWAGMSVADNMIPIPWNQYGGRGGVNASYVRSHGSQYYGYESPNNTRARVFNHPDGHPEQVGEEFPDHHQCPHFHAINARGEEKIFKYKRGS